MRQDADDVERVLTSVSGDVTAALRQDAARVERVLTTASGTVTATR